MRKTFPGWNSRCLRHSLNLHQQRLLGEGARIIGTVHDEIILEIPEEMANDAVTILRDTMIMAGKTYLGKVPIEVEVANADNWAGK